MITCEFHGRLGNNLFQIATTIALADKLNTSFIFPEYALAGHRGKVPVDLSMFQYKFERGDLKVQNEYHEPAFEYRQIPAVDNSKIAGFFQSWEYFESVKYILRNKYFIPSDEVQTSLSKYVVSENSLGISIRRGDYLMLQHNHCVLGIEYYQSILDSYFENKVDQIYVFSDDLDWCREVFGTGVNYVQDTAGAQLFLMSRMKHLILSNSTFAWWGAYLNTREGTIIAPDPWFGPANIDKSTKGLYYPGWLRHTHQTVQHPYSLTPNMFN